MDGISTTVDGISTIANDISTAIFRTANRSIILGVNGIRLIGKRSGVGRALEGTIDMIDDIVRSGQSILLLGKPGVGKTTKLREVARILSDQLKKRVPGLGAQRLAQQLPQ